MRHGTRPAGSGTVSEACAGALPHAITMLEALKRHAGKHALFYVIALGFGLQAFGTGFYDNFWPIEPADMAKLGWWQILAAVLKSLSFAVGIVVGYLLKGPQATTEPKGDTTSLTKTETTTETLVRPPNAP